ncbi:MFS transporter [Aestuariispira insulae]|uniref:MFS-type transporter involved in bile tolerance (Atg22 family) n=1 Tax=Aestuariispira insulae TaxID=1461337 RepID=A0A3D9HPF1_9PROT|nr:MFS transporter [Aestuariispira insulae]RED51339.1 MFS-type transporter involved in bile tolerance (Atg22 family) [Aestuariispira insulae]
MFQSSLFRDRNVYLLVGANLLTSMGYGIALIAIPWLLINQPGGEARFGFIAFLAYFLIFLTGPFLGVFIDRYDRKRVLVAFRLVMLLILAAMLLLAPAGDNAISWLLSAYFMLSSLFLMLNQGARTAFIQENYDPKSYQALNSVIEIEGQLAAVITGGVAALMLDRWSLAEIILVNMALFAGSTVLVGLLKRKNMGENANHVAEPSVDGYWEGFFGGLRHLIHHPGRFLFLCGSFMPYLCVQTNNFLLPVLLVRVVQASVQELALYEMMFGGGAVMAGLLVPFLARRYTNRLMINSCMVLFTTVMILQAIWPGEVTLVWMAIFLGTANSIIRISRNSWMMNHIEPRYLGRVSTALPALMQLVKALMIGAVTLLVGQASPVMGLWLLVGLLVISCVACFMPFDIKRSQVVDPAH